MAYSTPASVWHGFLAAWRWAFSYDRSLQGLVVFSVVAQLAAVPLLVLAGGGSVTADASWLAVK